MKRIIIVVLMAVLFIAGCTDTVYIYVTPEPTPTVEPTPTATPTDIPTPTPTALPTPADAPAVSVPTPTTVPTYSYSWFVGNWTTCSLSCGNGTQERTVMCFRNDYALMDDSYCPSPKPVTIQECNTQDCPTTPTPTATPIQMPVLLNITWSDTNGNSSIDEGDTLTFNFNKAMDISTLRENYIINERLDPLGDTHKDYGSFGVFFWTNGNRSLTVTMDWDCSTTLAGRRVNPSDAVKDAEGYTDATPDDVYIPTP